MAWTPVERGVAAFDQVLSGQPLMAYVISWQMAVASRVLPDERRVGYDCEPALASAFKRSVARPAAAVTPEVNISHP